MVCKLKNHYNYIGKKSLRCWNTLFNDYLKSLEFEQSAADLCVCQKILFLYVYIKTHDRISNPTMDGGSHQS